MKKQLLWLTGLMFLCIPLTAQVHTLTFTCTVPPLPVANAGADTLVQCSLPFVLKGLASGGTAPYTVYWQPGNFLNDSTLLQPTATIAAQTSFTLNISDSNGCKVSDQVVIGCSTIGVDELIADAIRLIPNPSGGQFLLTGIPVTETPLRVTCQSLQGSLLAEQWLSPGQREILLDLSFLPAGAYHLILHTPGSKLVHKLIIQK